MLAALSSVLLPITASAPNTGAASAPSATRAVIAVEGEELRGVSAAESSAILKTLSEAIAARVDAEVIVVDAAALGCPSDQRCSEKIRERTNADQIVFVRMIGIPATIRFIAEVETKSGGSSAASGDVSREPSARMPAIEKIVDALFPETPEPEPPKTEPPKTGPPKTGPPIAEPTIVPRPVEPPKPEPHGHTISWVLFGGGAAMIATGIAFGLENRSARNEGETTSDPMRVDDLKTKALYTGLIADIAFGLAAIAVATGALLFALD